MRSLGSSKERGQPGVTTEDSPATHSRECCIHQVWKLQPGHSEFLLYYELMAPSTGELGQANIRMQCVLSVRSNSRWLWYSTGTKKYRIYSYLESRAHVPTLAPLLWKRKEQCTAEQLQLRALKNLEFSQVSGFSAVKKPPKNNKPSPQKPPTNKTFYTKQRHKA